MRVKFEDIRNAFDFVSCSRYGSNEAFLRKDTGKIFYLSESEELGDLDEVTEEDLDSEEVVYIPHKNDLDLGTQLVFNFVRVRLPGEYDRVQGIFKRPGAYSRFRSHLESKGLLQAWYDFENAEEEKALREWCKENGIELVD